MIAERTMPSTTALNVICGRSSSGRTNGVNFFSELPKKLLSLFRVSLSGTPYQLNRSRLARGGLSDFYHPPEINSFAPAIYIKKWAPGKRGTGRIKVLDDIIPLFNPLFPHSICVNSRTLKAF